MYHYFFIYTISDLFGKPCSYYWKKRNDCGGHQRCSLLIMLLKLTNLKQSRNDIRKTKQKMQNLKRNRKRKNNQT